MMFRWNVFLMYYTKISNSLHVRSLMICRKAFKRGTIIELLTECCFCVFCLQPVTAYSYDQGQFAQAVVPHSSYGQPEYSQSSYASPGRHLILPWCVSNHSCLCQIIAVCFI